MKFTKLNMDIVESNAFRKLDNEAQLLYFNIYLSGESGRLENASSYGKELYINFYKAVDTLIEHELVRYYEEYDAIQIKDLQVAEIIEGE